MLRASLKEVEATLGCAAKPGRACQASTLGKKVRPCALGPCPMPHVPHAPCSGPHLVEASLMSGGEPYGVLLLEGSEDNGWSLAAIQLSHSHGNRSPKPAQEGGTGLKGAGNTYVLQSFNAVDTNHDGVVDQAEWSAAQHKVTRLCTWYGAHCNTAQSGPDCPRTALVIAPRQESKCKQGLLKATKAAAPSRHAPSIASERGPAAVVSNAASITETKPGPLALGSVSSLACKHGACGTTLVHDEHSIPIPCLEPVCAHTFLGLHSDRFCDLTRQMQSTN